uniref:RxLR effector candidate protein n=1 Tax=Hyaloperonospora arabidopsidis (strain Emoy2) TaxID=559515 RepID=M4BAB9_HYAAE
MNTHITLLDTFIKGFGGEDKLASVLWIAKLSPIYRVEAQHMQGELFHKLLESGMKIDDVGVSAKTKRVLAYQKLETITASALLLEVRRHEIIDICDYLIENLGHRDFAMLIGYASLVDRLFMDELEKEMFRRLKTRGVKPIPPRPVGAGAGLDEEIEASMMEKYVTFCCENETIQPPLILHNFFLISHAQREITTITSMNELTRKCQMLVFIRDGLVRRAKHRANHFFHETQV